ncbi:MAG: hypothetical protein WD872_14500, partial [Pirellulaceae bacterium]
TSPRRPTTWPSSAVANGRDLDPATLVNLRVRYFDPTPGQWLSEEPVGCRADDANVTPYVGQ